MHDFSFLSRTVQYGGPIYSRSVKYFRNPATQNRALDHIGLFTLTTCSVPSHKSIFLVRQSITEGNIEFLLSGSDSRQLNENHRPSLKPHYFAEMPEPVGNFRCNMGLPYIFNRFH
jgi:hypothetical protein